MNEATYFWANMRWILKILFVANCCLGYSQGNPFDIRNQAKELSTTEIIVANDTISDQSLRSLSQPDNPFDIRKGPTVIPPSALEKTTTVIKPEVSKPKTSASSHLSKPLLGVLLSLCVVMIAFGMAINRVRFNHLVETLYNNNTLKNLYRNNPDWIGPQNLLLYTSYGLSISIFIHLMSQQEWISPVALSFWKIPFIVALIYLIRHLIMYLISYVYLPNREADLHNFTIGIHNMLLGLILVPVCLGIVFGPEVLEKYFIYFGIFAIVLAYFFRQIKGIITSVAIKGFNPIYFFIYLCAIEIAPFLILLKVLD